MSVLARYLARTVETAVNLKRGALARILSLRFGEQLVYKNLGNEVGVDEKTAKKWVKTLKGLYFGFEVRPWFRNVENSIRKTPKWFVRYLRNKRKQEVDFIVARDNVPWFLVEVKSSDETLSDALLRGIERPTADKNDDVLIYYPKNVEMAYS